MITNQIQTVPLTVCFNQPMANDITKGLSIQYFPPDDQEDLNVYIQFLIRHKDPFQMALFKSGCAVVELRGLNWIDKSCCDIHDFLEFWINQSTLQREAVQFINAPPWLNLPDRNYALK